MAEWFKAPVLKTGVPARVPWVRIPPHPPTLICATGTRRNSCSPACTRKVAQEPLEHSTISITLDLYRHVTATMQEDAAAKIDAAFGALKWVPRAAAEDGRSQLR